MLSAAEEDDSGGGTGDGASLSELSRADLQTGYGCQHRFRGVSTLAFEDRIEAFGETSVKQSLKGRGREEEKRNSGTSQGKLIF